MTSVIVVENLSKKYIIDHQRQERYTALRDVLADSVRRVGSTLFRARTERPDPEHEEFWALRDVSFEIHQGDRVGIIGRNGAGKSTLLKVLSRITEPTLGKVSIKGRVASLLEVGTGFHPELTGRENIYLNGAILGMSKAEIAAKFDEIVAFAEVEKFLDTPVKRYSSGMYVRLAFAVAAHLEPEILIIDEVLAVGDAQFQKKCLGEMEKRSKCDKGTLLFVSHNINAIKTLCNKAILLKNGQIAEFGNVEKVVGRYVEDFSEKGQMVREWSGSSAPQNSFAMLRRVSACDESGQPLRDVFTNTPINVSIEFSPKVAGVAVGVTLVVYDAEGTCIFSSINNQDEKWYGKPLKLGKYASICQIPRNFLNNGLISVSVVLFGRHFSEPVVEKDVLQIKIQDSAELRLDFFGEYGGFLRPKLIWENIKLNEDI